MSVASNCTESICTAYECSLWLQRMVLGLMIVAYYCSNKVVGLTSVAYYCSYKLVGLKSVAYYCKRMYLYGYECSVKDSICRAYECSI
jgi:hypothetical protein